MTKRMAFMIILVLLLPMLLAACGGGPSEDDIEEAVKAVIEDGNADKWNELACEAEKIEGEEAEGAGIDVDSVDCKIDGDSFNCKVDLASEDAPEIEVAGKIKDDKLCDIADSE